MNPLDLLKTQLQNALNESIENEDFKEALRDAINACNLNNVAALEQWIEPWDQRPFGKLMSEEDIHYCSGVDFVEEQWYKITGMF